MWFWHPHLAVNSELNRIWCVLRLMSNTLLQANTTARTVTPVYVRRHKPRRAILITNYRTSFRANQHPELYLKWNKLLTIITQIKWPKYFWLHWPDIRIHMTKQMSTHKKMHATKFGPQKHKMQYPIVIYKALCLHVLLLYLRLEPSWMGCGETKLGTKLLSL